MKEKLEYNSKCLRCSRSCKQSKATIIMQCNLFDKITEGNNEKAVDNRKNK